MVGYWSSLPVGHWSVCWCLCGWLWWIWSSQVQADVNVISDFTNNSGKIISLTQHGSHVAMNSVANIPNTAPTVMSACISMSKYDIEAHVLMRTWPACGNFVLGSIKAMAIPKKAAGLTMYHSSIKPKWIRCSQAKSSSRAASTCSSCSCSF